MIRTTLAAMAALTIGTAAAAAECDQDDAMERLQKAINSGSIRSMGAYDDLPTLVVDGALWEVLKLETRIGMFVTFECALYGEGSYVEKAQVLDERGIQMAVWDGIHRSIDAKR